jgi:hypothetical protein
MCTVLLPPGVNLCTVCVFDPRHLLTQLALSELFIFTADDFFEAYEAAPDGSDAVLQQPLVYWLTLPERLAYPSLATSQAADIALCKKLLFLFIVFSVAWRSHIMKSDYSSFERVEDFKYLGTTLTNHKFYSGRN